MDVRAKAHKGEVRTACGSGRFNCCHRSNACLRGQPPATAGGSDFMLSWVGISPKTIEISVVFVIFYRHLVQDRPFEYRPDSSTRGDEITYDRTRPAIIFDSRGFIGLGRFALGAGAAKGASPAIRRHLF